MKQLLIGIDAMEWSLVRKWAEEGKLPTFKRLIETGSRANLTTTAAQLPDTVWACIYTGTNPAKFQKYFYVQYDAKTGDLRNVSDDEIHGIPFWDVLSEAGLRVGIVDLAKFPLSRNLNGFQVTNWGAHATKTARASSPPSLLKDIDVRFGKHPVGDCDSADAKPKALLDLRRRVLEGVRLHGELFRALMREQQWDVFFAAFSAAHCIGHHFWHWADPTHPRHSDPDPVGLGDSIERVYCAIDREIGEMLAIAGEDTRAMVFSGHGMGPIYHASWNLQDMLDLWGYGRSAAPQRAPNHGNSKGKINPWRVLKMVMPGALQYQIKAMLPKSLQDELLFRWYAGSRDWKGCRAFAVPNNDSVGAIRVSVRGRDRDGIVDPGEEYESICEDISQALYDLQDPVTGKPVVRRVTWSQREFQGPFLHQLPDLTILWDQSFAWDSVTSSRFGVMRIRTQDSRSGSHTPLGFVLISGPAVPPGVEMERRSIYDIAPTVLEAAGVPIPERMDGHPLPLRERVPA